MNVIVVSFLAFSCFIVCLRLVNAYKHENKTRRKRFDDCSYRRYKQNILFCHTASLTIVPFADSDKKSITVAFSLNDHTKFKGCFPYYDVFLKQDGNIAKEHKLIIDSFASTNFSHTFKDVPPGLYRVDVQPCYSFECCANLTIFHPDLLKITSYDLSGQTQEILSENPNPVVLSVILVAIAGLIISICVLYSHFCSTLNRGNVVENNSIKEDFIPEKTSVYILHYHDRFDVNKRKANILKDFLKQSSIYHSVKTINDELALILFNVHKWSKSVMKEKDKDGRVQKIILIDSKEENEEGAIENLIFYNFLAMLNDDLFQCLSSYDNLFVVQFGETSGFCDDQLRNVVRRHRYSIPKHALDLGVNLYSAPDSYVPSVKKQLRKIYAQHPIRNMNLVSQCMNQV